MVAIFLTDFWRSQTNVPAEYAPAITSAKNLRAALPNTNITHSLSKHLQCFHFPDNKSNLSVAAGHLHDMSKAEKCKWFERKAWNVKFYSIYHNLNALCDTESH